MSKHARSFTPAPDDTVTLNTGLDAFQSSPEFRGPVEDVDGHGCNDHFAQIYETDEERFAAAVPFVRHGLERGERVMYVIDKSSEEEVTAALRDGGIDVDTARESGALSFHTVQETYLRNGEFAPDEMIDFYAETVADVTDEYEALRIVAETTWLQDDSTTVPDFMEYEAKINELFAETESLAICQYDRRGFPPEIIRDIVQSHPHLIYDGTVCHNFYYTPPAEFFADDDAEREVDRMLGTLHDRATAKTQLQQREQLLRECYDIAADPSLSFEDKLHDMLDIAREWTGLELAGLTHLPEWDGAFLNEYAIGYGGDGDGIVTAADGVWTDPDEGCFCRQVIESDEPVGKTDVRGTSWEADQIYQEHGLTCYLGTKVTSGATPYGTLWVGSTEPRDRAFTDTERTFLDLLGQWVSYELERREHTETQRTLYEVTTDPDRAFDEKLDALFELGCDRFGLDVAGLAKIDPETDYFEVETVSGNHDHLVPGAEYPLSETYCRLVTAGGETAAVTDPGDAGFEDHMCYDRFGVQTYLGTHVVVDGDVDRTFWFLSTESRDTPITDEEQAFVDLMGQWVQYELEQQQRERELRERTDHLNAVIETAPECIKTVAPDGTLLQMNAAGLEMVEAPEASAVTGGNIYDLIVSEDRDRFRDFNERVCDGERGTLEFDIIGLDGTRRHMESHAAPLERPDGTTVHVALTRDVTEQKERQAELRQTKERFETVFEQSDDGIFILDPNAGEIVDANPAAAKMNGYTREELLALAPSDLHPDELEEFHAFLAEAREQGSAWTEDLHCRHKDDHDVPAEITASAITLDGRELVLALVRHIEDRKKHERYQRDLHEITADPDLDFEAKVERLLELGRDRFGLEMGGLNHLPEWNGAFRLEKGIGLEVDPEEELWTDPDTDCYCRRTVSDDEPVGVPDVRGTHWTGDAIYREFGMTSYLGTTVETGAQSYGTLWFGSTEPRDRPFSDAERSFIDLMAQWIGYEIERRQRKQAQRDLYEIIADTGVDTDTKIDRLLGVGSDYLDLPIGMLNCDAGDALEIKYLHGDHPELAVGGYTPPESEHYCRETVDTGSPVIVADTAAAGWDDDPLYNEIGLAAYAGAPVTVGDEPYGTLCFAATSPRRAPITDGERTFLDLLRQCVGYELERARREARLHALSSLGQALLDTESTAEVGECLVKAAGQAYDMPVAAVALYDDETGTLPPVATSPAAAELLEEVAVFDAPDGAAWDAFVTGDTTCRQAVAMDAPEAPSVTELVAYPLGDHGVFVFGTTDPYGFRDGDRDVIATAAAHVRAALARADREQQLQEREQVLEEQNETLARLNRVNDTIRSVDQALVEARTRDEIERVVCEELADRGPYELAWIGEYDGAIGEVTPVTSAGTDKGYLDRITVTADDTQEGCGPTGRAIKTGDPQVVNDVISDESFAPWRQDALNRGFHASAALPLTYDDSRYGVLNLYAGQPGVFDDLEREVLTELSNTVAHAINAVESKKSLVSPTVDELEFEVTDDALASVAMSRALDCDAELKRLVPRDDGRINMFFTVDGATPDDVLAFQSELPTTDLRVVSEGDDGSPCLFEAELTEESLGQTVTDHGGRLRRVRIEDGVAQVIVRLGQDADTREFVEMFQTKYLDSELVANRTRQLSHQTPFEFAETMMEDLTDRQREVLETAYFNGYFEEPRNRTASEIADIMDIAQPTFNSHLRAAMRKVYIRIFEDELVAE